MEEGLRKNRKTRLALPGGLLKQEPKNGPFGDDARRSLFTNTAAEWTRRLSVPPPALGFLFISPCRVGRSPDIMDESR